MKRTAIAVGAAMCAGFLAAGAILHAPVVTHNDTPTAMVASIKQ